MATKTKFQNSLGDALGGFWTNYVGWGRATRSEFWWVYLFYTFLVGNVLFNILSSLALSAGSYELAGFVGLLYIVWLLATLVPSFTLCARRLHDAGHSNWNICWSFLPIIGWIILLVYFCQSGEKKANKWGAPRI